MKVKWYGEIFKGIDTNGNLIIEKDYSKVYVGEVVAIIPFINSTPYITDCAKFIVVMEDNYFEEIFSSMCTRVSETITQ